MLLTNNIFQELGENIWSGAACRHHKFRGITGSHAYEKLCYLHNTYYCSVLLMAVRSSKCLGYSIGAVFCESTDSFANK